MYFAPHPASVEVSVWVNLLNQITVLQCLHFHAHLYMYEEDLYKLL